MDMEFSATYGIAGLVILVLTIIAEWRIFTKAGQSGWKSLIPIYNAIVELGFSWRKGKFWSIVLASFLFGIGQALTEYSSGEVLDIVAMLLMVVGGIAVLVLTVKAVYYLAQSFGHGLGFTIGLILVPTVFRLILGLGSSQYRGNGYNIAKKKSA